LRGVPRRTRRANLPPPGDGRRKFRR
jgi:hypothetical protein